MSNCPLGLNGFSINHADLYYMREEKEVEQGKKKKNVHDEGCGPSSFATERGSQTVRGSMARGTIFQPNFHSDYFPKSKILFHARHTLSLSLSLILEFSSSAGQKRKKSGGERERIKRRRRRKAGSRRSWYPRRPNEINGGN